MQRAGLGSTLRRLSCICLLYALVLSPLLVVRAAPTPTVSSQSPSALSSRGDAPFPASNDRPLLKTKVEISSSPAVRRTPSKVDFRKEESLVYLEPRGFFHSIGHFVSHAAHSVTHAVSSAVRHAVKAVVDVHKAAFHAVVNVHKAVIHTVGRAASAVHHAIRHVAHTIHRAVKHIGQAIGQAYHSVKNAAKFIIKNVPLIAKVGLKVLASSEGLVGTVAKFVPGVGVPMAKLLKMSSKGIDAASNMIPVKVGGALGAAMKVMDVAEDPIAAGMKAVGIKGALGEAAKMILD